MEELRINVQIADRPYVLHVEPDTEAVIRQAARKIQEELNSMRAGGRVDTQEALAMIAFNCLVNSLRKEKQMQRLQQVIFDKVNQLDKAATSAIAP